MDACRPKMLALVVLMAFAAVTAADKYEDAFVNFMQTHQKAYEHHEFQSRFEVGVAGGFVVARAFR